VIVCADCGHEAAEPFKFCPECGAPARVGVPAREQRKVVTVLFCDVTGSTSLGESLDPESLRALLARYFERMKAIVEWHGGTVEKFIGDAVMAVFGIPRLHEDDALRAVRAALEMREALPELGVQARIGVTTGEVVTGTEERLATGDAVNLAARLEQAARPGEVLIGAETLQLVHDVVEVAPVETLVLKGKSEPVRAWRLLAVTGETARRHGAPMVGRERQRRLLPEAFANVRDDRACHLVTILGAAGVGKSRLAAEFLADVDATVVRGRCLSYGEGITYWPVIEVLKQLGTKPADEVASAAVDVLLGEADEPATPDQIAWALRKTLEQAAAERPLVAVFDDLHWGEPAFLDLVEHVADFSRDAPILLLCMARPELFDRRPGWAGGKLNATTVLLEPLTPQETDELIERLAPVDDALRARIREAAEGNPLFVEEMLAMVRDSGNGGEVVVPPTIQALLAARLDQLDPSERAVLERGAVEGKVFHRGAVEALAPEETQVSARLMALVRKELVRPDRAQLAGDDAFRFRHLLIRDAAYDALPKAVRAELHERFAVWLEEHGAELVELDEILGYHLEQACRYRVELGAPDDGALTAAARTRLTSAGRRALSRQDLAAAVNLLERAAALVPPDEVDVALEIDRIDALFFSGKPHDARRLAGAVSERARAAGDRIGELCGRIEEAKVRLYIEPEGAAAALAEVIDEALPVFEAAGDELALYVAYRALAQVAHMRALMDTALEALETAVVHARRTGLSHHEISAQPALGAARYFGSTPVPELIAWLDEQQQRGLRHIAFRFHRATALAMLGRSDEARAIVAELRAEIADRGAMILLALATGHVSVEVERLAGDPAAAAEFGREGCRLLEQLGEQAWLSTGAGLLAQALCSLDRLDEADAWAERAAELGASDDAITQMLWRQVRAKVLAARGAPAEAEKLAREAIVIGEQTDLVDARGDSYADLAEVLALGGKTDDAVQALEHALANYTRKGNLVGIKRAQSRLAELTAASRR
jgi:class 3 adenylate cyclase/tetratricopeptide (TPR) repeat protein